MSYLPSKPGKTILPEILKMWPERSSKIVQYHEEIMRGPSRFTVAERELIFAYGSGVNACQWCYGAHRHTAAEFGVEPDLFEQLMADIDTADIDEKMKPVLKLVRKLTLTPSRVTQADADAVFDAGWDEDAYFDVVTICALHNYMNRLADGMGVEGSEELFREAGKRLSTISYEGVARLTTSASGKD